ncbi:3'-5' exonuclease [Psychrobacter ciconiae]|uniref:3'-5' exonuclease n=1 Tax=Psychrobacter ciconiae TaxID=1553449 RepID=UPI00191846E8|nr:3'-5' exonuclease [Psychrobacter ciconiae]
MTHALPFDPVLVFDIETAPDIAAARRIYPELSKLTDADALSALTAIRVQESGRSFMRLPFQRIVCISFLYVKNGVISLRSLSAEQLSEKDILQTFFRAFQDAKNLPQLVSWNGSGFDIPVLLYRAMLYELSVPLLFEEGDTIREMRFDNYVNRYHNRHLDLMDRFSQFGASARQSMDIVASLYGLPGKTDVDGSMVGALVVNNDWQTLTKYCESDVLNTWLIYLRWLRLTGKLSFEGFNFWQNESKSYLQSFQKDELDVCRHQEFLADWESSTQNLLS